MPLFRRLSRRGFRNNFNKQLAQINVFTLNCSRDGNTINLDNLAEKGLINRGKAKGDLRTLGNGGLAVKVTVQVAHFAKSASEEIEAAGGKAEVI